MLLVKKQCGLFVLIVQIISMCAAPLQPMLNQQFMHHPMGMDQIMMKHQILDQQVNQAMDRQFLEQLMMQHNQYEALQQQQMVMRQIQAIKNLNSIMLSQSPQTLLILLPDSNSNIFAKSTEPSTKPNNAELNQNLEGDIDTVAINAEDSDPKIDTYVKRPVIILPNGQRLIIGSIISAIPFLPFEVNVPDTISWIYNGIAGIIGGIGQRLPFRPKPPSEIQMPEVTPIQEQIMPAQETGLKLWMQKLKPKKQNVGMPIIMLPVPIQK